VHILGGRKDNTKTADEHFPQCVLLSVMSTGNLPVSY